MIRHLYRSKSDIENLSRLRTSTPKTVDKFDYKKIVVNKPWGYEYLMFENPFVSIWILAIKHNHKTSMHCHPNKKTSLIVVSGKVVCNTLEGWIKRKEKEGLIIDEAVFHSTWAVSKEGAMIMEVETPPNKRDLVRLKDEYGRENQGYESFQKMTRRLSKYDYIDFHKEIKRKCTKILKNSPLSISFVKNTSQVYEKIKEETGNLICLLQGKLHDINGNIILSVGETRKLSEIKGLSQIFAFGDIMYLTL